MGVGRSTVFKSRKGSGEVRCILPGHPGNPSTSAEPRCFLVRWAAGSRVPTGKGNGFWCFLIMVIIMRRFFCFFCGACFSLRVQFGMRRLGARFVCLMGLRIEIRNSTLSILPDRGHVSHLSILFIAVIERKRPAGLDETSGRGCS